MLAAFSIGLIAEVKSDSGPISRISTSADDVERGLHRRDAGVAGIDQGQHVARVGNLDHLILSGGPDSRVSTGAESDEFQIMEPVSTPGRRA